MALRLESFDFAATLQVWLVPAIVFPITVLTFARLGLYRAVIRFISSQALVAILIGVSVSAVLMSLVALTTGVGIPRSVPGIYAALLFLSVGGTRFIMRTMFRKPAHQNRKPVLIYGAGEAGRQLAHALAIGRDYMPVAFLDDDPSLHNSTVAGKRVYPAAHARLLINEFRVSTILLALPSVSRARRREIVAGLEPLGIEVKRIPGMADVVTGRASFTDLRSVTP